MAWKYQTDDGEVEIQVSKELLLSALTASKAMLSDYAVGIEPAPQSVSFALLAILVSIDHAMSTIELDYAPATPDKATIDKISQHTENTMAQQENTGLEGP